MRLLLDGCIIVNIKNGDYNSGQFVFSNVNISSKLQCKKPNRYVNLAGMLTNLPRVLLA